MSQDSRPDAAGPRGADPATPGQAAPEPSPDGPQAAILAAARRLFAAQGFAGTSTRSIAEAAGVNLAMIHYYFGNKEQLYRQVVEREFTRLFAFVKEMTAREPDPAAFLAAMPGHVMTMSRENPELRQLLIREMVDGAPRLPALVREMGDRGPLGLRRHLATLAESAEAGGLTGGIPTAHLLVIIFAIGHGTMAFAPLLAEVFGLDPREPVAAAALAAAAGTMVSRTIAGKKEE
ncbi:MAG: TetR/AcrR family transcriptional regulator [Candidatus Krumholzibacteriia bacterium]